MNSLNDLVITGIPSNQRNVVSISSDQQDLFIDHFAYEYLNRQDLMELSATTLVNKIADEIQNPVEITAGVTEGYDYCSKTGRGILDVTVTDYTSIATMFSSYNKGSQTVTLDPGDGLGMRYGAYQWPDSNVTSNGLSTIDNFLSFADLSSYFYGIERSTSAFASMWRYVANLLGPSVFLALQGEYAESLFALGTNFLSSNFLGFNLSSFNLGGATALFSAVNKFGGDINSMGNFFTNAFRGLDFGYGVDSGTLINSIFQERFQIDKYNLGFPADYRMDLTQGLFREFQLTKNLNFAAIGSDTIPLSGASVDDFLSGAAKDVENATLNRLAEFQEGTGPAPVFMYQDPEVVADKGFEDPYGQTPKKTRLGEPDYDRLTRGVTADTPVEYKENKAATGIKTATGGEWAEPTSPYKAEYPHNNVFTTKGGIVIEIDDTPGQARIHVYHPSHTYIEIDKEGNRTERVAKNIVTIIDRDGKFSVAKDYDASVGNNKTEMVGGARTTQVKGEEKLTVTGNITVTGATINLN